MIQPNDMETLFYGAVQTAATNPEYRFGQALANQLHKMYPELSRWLTINEHDKDLDPFYNDDNIPTFLEWVEGAMSEERAIRQA